MDIRHPDRLLLIGLDGLNWDLVEPFIRAGVMPHLARLRREGVWGPLTSVIPTQSATAWASFITGQNPARHGVFDFMSRQADGSYRHAKPDPATTLWSFLGRAGLRVGVLNFPVTYPPDAVNGFLVSGMLSPKGRTFTYPPALGDEMLAAVPGYRLDVEWQLYAGRETALLRACTDMTRLRAQAACWLQQRYRPDVLAAAFIAPDRLQHALWRRLDPTHPLHDPAPSTAEGRRAEALAGSVHRFYATLDEAVGQLVSASGDGTAVILLSDHGFQAAKWQFRVDEWLAERGWLVRQEGRSRLERLARQFDTPWVRRVRRKLVKDISRHLPTFAPGGTLDWSRSVAFGAWPAQQGIRLNVRDREPQGIVGQGTAYERLREEMSAALLETTEPLSGQRAVDRVWKREELYEAGGPFFDQMPDLVFSLRPGFSASPVRPTLWAPTGWASGDHSLEGLFVMWGQGVKSFSTASAPDESTRRDRPEIEARITGAELIDVAPTALYLMGLAVPDSMDGQVLVAALDGNLVTDNPVRRQAVGASIVATATEQPLTPGEEAELKQRLRGLGYLG